MGKVTQGSAFKGSQCHEGRSQSNLRNRFLSLQRSMPASHVNVKERVKIFPNGEPLKILGCQGNMSNVKLQEGWSSSLK